MLTLFVLASDKHCNPKNGIASFGDLATKVINVGSLKEVREYPIATEWYAVLYDNEVIDEQLQAAISVFLLVSYADVFILYRRSETDDEPAQRTPRIFKYDILPSDNSLLPDDPDRQVSFETILNGWVVGRNADV